MKVRIAGVLALLLVSCASTYDMPLQERSREYEAAPYVVWDAALDSINDVSLSVVVAEPENGFIRARSRGTIWDLRGYVVQIVVRDIGDGRYRVDANAEAVSEDSVVDFGAAKRMVRDYLRALDERMDSVRI